MPFPTLVASRKAYILTCYRVKPLAQSNFPISNFIDIMNTQTNSSALIAIYCNNSLKTIFLWVKIKPKRFVKEKKNKTCKQFTWFNHWPASIDKDETKLLLLPKVEQKKKCFSHKTLASKIYPTLSHLCHANPLNIMYTCVRWLNSNKDTFRLELRKILV